MTRRGSNVEVAVASTSPALAAAYAAGLVAVGVPRARSVESRQVPPDLRVVLIADEGGDLPVLPARTRTALSLVVATRWVAPAVRARADAIVDADQPLQRQLHTLADALLDSASGVFARLDGRRAKKDDRLAQLTPRELQVLRALMAGSPASTIAAALVLSVPTVRAHIRSILVKLGVNSQLAATALACRELCRPGRRGCESSHY